LKRIIQARIFRGDQQYVAECLDLPVVTQAPTLDELARNIQEAVALHLEGENLAELGLAPKSHHSCQLRTRRRSLMPKLKVLSGAEVLRILNQFGFVSESQRGSHVKVRRALPFSITHFKTASLQFG
jgi:predicted RNase H-like HicB family nuclease